MIEDRVYYFGLVPDEYKEDHNSQIPKDWEPNYYFRIRVVAREEEIKVEDSCGRMVPFLIQNISELMFTLRQTQKHLIEDILGEPV